MEFLTRIGCHLCEDALPTAQRVATLTRSPLHIIEIDSDDELVKEFGLRIPVVRAGDGTVLAEGIIQFRTLLKAAIRRRLG
ncbi:MAG: glutaredoxin family protein [Acidimicrobiia bacterium]